MSHCVPEVTLKPIRFQFTPKTVYYTGSNNVIMSSSRKCTGSLFQTRGSARHSQQQSLMSPNVLCVRGTAVGYSACAMCRWTSGANIQEFCDLQVTPLTPLSQFQAKSTSRCNQNILCALCAPEPVHGCRKQVCRQWRSQEFATEGA